MNGPSDVVEMPIGQFARMCQVSVKTLRHYHDVGILEPARIDRRTGYRYYHSHQIRTASAIVSLRNVGMPLVDIACLLAADHERVRGLLGAHRDRLTGQFDDAKRRLVLIEALITKEIDDMYDITIERVPAIRVVREHLDVPSKLGAVAEAAALARLATRLMQHGTVPSAQPILVIHSADEQRTTEDACLPVADGADLGSEFDQTTLPGCEMATATHIGPLDELVYVVHAVMGWLTGSGRHVEMPFRVQLLSIPPLFTVESAGGHEQPVAKVLVPFS